MKNKNYTIRQFDFVAPDILQDCNLIASSSQITSNIEQDVNTNSGVLFLALKNSFVHGFLHGQGGFGNPQMQLHSLFVEKRFFANGIGGQLLQHYCQFAKSRGATQIITDVPDFLPHARNFFLKQGFVQAARQNRLVKKL